LNFQLQALRQPSRNTTFIRRQKPGRRIAPQGNAGSAAAKARKEQAERRITYRSWNSTSIRSRLTSKKMQGLHQLPENGARRGHPHSRWPCRDQFGRLYRLRRMHPPCPYQAKKANFDHLEDIPDREVPHRAPRSSFYGQFADLDDVDYVCRAAGYRLRRGVRGSPARRSSSRSILAVSQCARTSSIP
jgi:hypothetical protein